MKAIIICSNDVYFTNPLIKKTIINLKKFDCDVKGIYLLHGFFEWRRIVKTLFIIGIRGVIKLLFWRNKLSLDSVAKELKLPLYDYDSSKVLKENVDMIFVFNINKIIKKDILLLPKKGCINLHFGYLPRYRGIFPAFWAHYNGEDYMGITCYKMDKGIDTGYILYRGKIRINPAMNLVDIYQKGFEQAENVIIKGVNNLLKGRLTKQNDLRIKPTYYGMPTIKDILKYKLKRLTTHL